MELSMQERLKHLHVECDLTPEQTAERMDVPVEYVNVCMRQRCFKRLPTEEI